MDEQGEVVELFADEDRLERVAAIDIGKSTAMVCTRVPSASSPERRVQKTFPVATTTAAISDLAGQLTGLGAEVVVLESTADYWRPFFYLLEAAGLKVWLVNARDVKNVPSRPKTDKLDAIWLAKLAERQMLRPSFVPPKPIRQLRGLTRLRTTLVAERTGHRNQVEKVLEDACIKVSDKKEAASDIFGVSGRAMLDAVVAGERDPRTLAELARGRMRVKIPKLVQALTGPFEDHHAYLIGTLLQLHDQLNAKIAELDARIAAAIADIDPTPPPDDDHPGRMPCSTGCRRSPASDRPAPRRSSPRSESTHRCSPMATTSPPGPNSPRGPSSPATKTPTDHPAKATAGSKAPSDRLPTTPPAPKPSSGRATGASSNTPQPRKPWSPWPATSCISPGS